MGAVLTKTDTIFLFLARNLSQTREVLNLCQRIMRNHCSNSVLAALPFRKSIYCWNWAMKFERTNEPSGLNTRSTIIFSQTLEIWWYYFLQDKKIQQSNGCFITSAAFCSASIASSFELQLYFLQQLQTENKQFSDRGASLRRSHNNNHPTLKFINGIIYQSGKPVLSKQSLLKLICLQEFHITPSAGHAGIAKTYSRLAANVFLEDMK